MKKKKFLIVLLSIVAVISAMIGLCACRTRNNNTAYTITIDKSQPVIVDVGASINYRKYFLVTDRNGNFVIITDDMLDTSKEDTSKEGFFTVTLTVGNSSKDLTFTVKKAGNDDNDNTNTTTDELKKVFAKYTDPENWNFAVTYQEVENGTVGYYDDYEYNGKNILYSYDRYDDDDNYLGEATDYLGYDDSQNSYYLYYDNLDGTYSKYKDGSTEFTQNYYLYDLDITTLGDYTFTKVNGAYEAAKPNDVGNVVIGEFTGYTWTKFTVQISNGNISQIDATMSDGFVLRFIFSKFGTVKFTLPDGSSSGGNTEPTGTMEKQVYNAATFDDERLQAKLTKTGNYADPAIGLPSKGEYHALVIPVQFSNTSISQEQLKNLNLAFNDTDGKTGWESVKSYYYKASYGQLNLSFDIAGYNIDGVEYYTSNKNYSYYEGLTATQDGETYNNGDNVLLKEVLNYYKSRLDLTKYDTNDDGAIDAVYLIYSAPVDYDSDDSFYWAYVTWDQDEDAYDEMDAYYYLFAGLDFMKESVQGGYTNEYYPVISGLTINASTYIHETGHLLGLDDYYDYYPNQGSNEGLGGADMMDATVGDQNVYSKTMLGWLTPQIVTSTTTVTIQSSQAKGDAILIPLNFNNSYFCEYLLIDLYSAEGLNAMHASMSGSYLYDGATYGVRIYHVSSWINNAYDNDYGSFTDNNNSMSDTALIKLVEADGESKFASDDGYAAADDLWQAGDKLSTAFPKYTTNGNKLLNFDITIVSVSKTQATITITYNS